MSTLSIQTPKVWTLVLAGGSGRRFGRPKQFEMLGDERLIDRVLRVAGSVTAGTTVVVPSGYQSERLDADNVVAGGDSHMASARRGLTAVPTDVDIILIALPSHPLATAGLCRQLIDACADRSIDASAPAQPLADALKQVVDGQVVATQSRAGLMACPFPAAFKASTLRQALAPADDGTVVNYAEELEAVENIGGKIVTIENEPTNIHVTTPRELEMARRLLGIVE